jgi:ParB/RepB/Spo0J family partition protein
MNGTSALQRLYETFELPIEALVIPQTNMRGIEPDAELRELALSIAAQGQLQPVLVMWSPRGYELVAGFRRAIAISTYGEELSLMTVRATRIRPEEADAARLVENFVRKNPTTFEFAEYFLQLHRGSEGRDKMSVPQIAAVVGKSTDYVRSLIRFARDLPPDIKAAWAKDRDQRFTFRALNDLVRISRQGDESGVRERFARILRVRTKLEAERSYKTADECLQEAIAGTGLEEPVESPEDVAVSASRRIRAMTRPEVQRLQEQLGRIGRNRLAAHDVSADLVFDLLQAIAGNLARGRAIEIVTDIVVATTDRAEPSVETEPRRTWDEKA